MESNSTAMARLAAALAARPEVRTAYVFGSAVKGSDAPRDLDVAVVGGSGTSLGELLRAQVDLERAVGVPIDLHEFERLPVDLQFRVVREGTVMVDRDPPARIRREIEVMNAYHDLAPYLERIRTGARQRLIRSVSADG